MTNEEMMADEKYHTCGRCKWENIPYICRHCKWGEDTRRDLWELKKDEANSLNCDDCVYSDIDWRRKDADSPAIPVSWCRKYRKFCEDVDNCEYEEESEDE